MSNATMTPVKEQAKTEGNEGKAGVRRPSRQMRYSGEGCRIDGHQGYGCTCTQIPARP